jgi:hypothetical protein
VPSHDLRSRDLKLVNANIPTGFEIIIDNIPEILGHLFWLHVRRVMARGLTYSLLHIFLLKSAHCPISHSKAPIFDASG